jgi:hypothetical protein
MTGGSIMGPRPDVVRFCELYSGELGPMLCVFDPRGRHFKLPIGSRLRQIIALDWPTLEVWPLVSSV